MSKPPIKAFETVKRYCENAKTCEGCPIHSKISGANCLYSVPANWILNADESPKNGENPEGKK